jgi:hypothetical protein
MERMEMYVKMLQALVHGNEFGGDGLHDQGVLQTKAQALSHYVCVYVIMSFNFIFIMASARRISPGLHYQVLAA